jgi:hypothetical protein
LIQSIALSTLCPLATARTPDGHRDARCAPLGVKDEWKTHRDRNDRQDRTKDFLLYQCPFLTLAILSQLDKTEPHPSCGRIRFTLVYDLSALFSFAQQVLLSLERLVRHEVGRHRIMKKRVRARRRREEGVEAECLAWYPGIRRDEVEDVDIRFFAVSDELVDDFFFT